MHWLDQKVAQRAPLGGDDLVPPSADYWDRLCGPVSKGSEPDVWIRDCLVPYRRHLLETDVVRGLDVCCLGAVHDDLMPGAWLEGLQNDAVWKALRSIELVGNPIVLLGALDVAMYRLGDKRFLTFAKGAVATLLDDFMGMQEDCDFFDLFQALYQFELNRLATTEEGAGKPGYWRRMGAWMQAGVVVRAFVGNNVAPRVEEFKKDLIEQLQPQGILRNLADAWAEPWSVFESIGDMNLRSRVLGQLDLLKSRHEGAGRVVPLAQEVEEKLVTQGGRGDRWRYTRSRVLRVRLPVGPIPSEAVDGLARSFPNEPLATISLLVSLSSSFILDDKILGKVIELVEGLDVKDDTSSTILLCASVIAAVSGMTGIADRIGEVICRWASKDVVREDVGWMIGLLLQTAASHREMEDCLGWFGQRLEDLAWALPKAPIDCVTSFLEYLQVLEVVLPIEQWCHLSAKRVAEMAWG